MAFCWIFENKCPRCGVLARFFCPRGRGFTVPLCPRGEEFALSKNSPRFAWGGGSSIVHGGIDTFFHITVPAVFEGMGVPAHFPLMEAPAQRLQHIETLREHHFK